MTTNRPYGDDVVRYVLGEMTQDEQLLLEVRMTEDDDLVREVGLAMALDEQLNLAAALGDTGRS